MKKKCPDCDHLRVKFSFRMQFLRVSKRKNQRFFPCGAFLSCVVAECLSKCPNSKKTPLPWKIPSHAPAEASFTFSTCVVLDYIFFKRLTIFFAKILFFANRHQITYFLLSLKENEYASIKYLINLKHPKKLLLMRMLAQRVEKQPGFKKSTFSRFSKICKKRLDGNLRY